MPWLFIIGMVALAALLSKSGKAQATSLPPPRPLPPMPKPQAEIGPAPQEQAEPKIPDPLIPDVVQPPVRLAPPEQTQTSTPTPKPASPSPATISKMEQVRRAQLELNKWAKAAGFAPLGTDGKLGPKTALAMEKALQLAIRKDPLQAPTILSLLQNLGVGTGKYNYRYLSEQSAPLALYLKREREKTA